LSWWWQTCTSNCEEPVTSTTEYPTRSIAAATGARARPASAWDRMFSRSDIGEGWHRQAVQRWEGELGELITAPKPV
jgi:hypothetical protein